MTTDLENLVRQVWSPEARPLTQEAWRCYNAGALRASIAATWTAVTADIITKLDRLADDGDGEAIGFRTELANAQAYGLTAEGVRAMQRIEDTLLERAARLELIDSIGLRELGRIREDRNLCVHPSLRMHGDVYDPLPQIAHGHLAVALNTLLAHPPTQGRKALEQFTAYICDPSFVPVPAHIQATFFDRTRSATRGTIVRFAAKHALLEIAPPTSVQLSAAEHADRMAIALEAFALRDRELVRTAVADLSGRFQPLEGGIQLRALVRLGACDFLWDMVDEALASRLDGLIGGLADPSMWWEPQPTDSAGVLALVRSPYGRAHLPRLEQRFSTMTYTHRLMVAASHPDPYFVPVVVESVKDSGGWRVAEQAALLAVQHAAFLDAASLQSILHEWAQNTQCRTAAQNTQTAISLFHAVAHLGPARGPAFQAFLAEVRAIEEPGTYYTYPALEAAMHAAGY